MNNSFIEGDILSDAEVEELFGETKEQEPAEAEENKDTKDSSREKSTTEELIDVDSLFDDSVPESVGSKEDTQGNKGGATSEKGNSPYVYASLAKALKEDGALLDLDDSEIEKITKVEDFVNAVEKTIQARFDDRQKRIDEALNVGVEPTVIHQYENILKQLDSITEDQLTAENESGETLRKQILYRDYVNKGFSNERAQREVNKSVSDGSDIEDARDALESIKKGVRTEYQAKLDEAKKRDAELQNERTAQAKELRRSILEDKALLGDVEIDRTTRQKALDAIVKPIYQDPKTGEKYTAIQKYELEHRTEFLKNLGIMFALTDGFTNTDKLVKNKVKKEVNKSIRALEDAINNTQRNNDGSLRFVTGTDDKDSCLNFTLDV